MGATLICLAILVLCGEVINGNSFVNRGELTDPMENEENVNLKRLELERFLAQQQQKFASNVLLSLLGLPAQGIPVQGINAQDPLSKRNSPYYSKQCAFNAVSCFGRRRK